MFSLAAMSERPIDRALAWAKEAGMTPADFARRLEVDDQLVTNWKKRGLPPRRHAEVAKIFGRTVDELVHGTGAVRQTSRPYVGYADGIPVVGTAQLGPDGHWLEREYPTGSGDGWIDMHSRDDNAYALRVFGDSMHPRIKSGEYVVVEPNHAIAPGDEVLVVTKDGRSMVKEFLFKRQGVVTLHSVNSDHGRMTLNESEIDKMHYVAAIARGALYIPD
jgi:phage repressor protein C with HTH and peptisase S24 domain